MAPATSESPTPERQRTDDKKKKAVKKKFMPYRTYIGKLDDFLGISMFWSEKLFIIIMYLQRYALMLLWPQMNWPVLFQERMTPMYAALLDFTAYSGRSVDANGDIEVTSVAEAVGAGTVFQGCQVICKIVWPTLCLPVLFIWACISFHRTLELYWTRNLERIAWGLVRIGLLPFVNTLMRYFILNQDGNIEEASQDLLVNWTTPVSEIGVVLLLLTICVFTYVSWRRSSHLILFDSKIRHEAWIRARELEYKLRFSTVYRNERVWMISSYTKSCWWWSFTRGLVDILLLAIMTFVPTSVGIIIGTTILGLNFSYGFLFVDIHRCKSSNFMEHILNLAMFGFAVIGCLRVYNVRNALLVDSDLDYFLFGLHGAAILAVLVLCVYYFVDSHKFGKFSIAEHRAQEKWKRQFGAKTNKGQMIAMEELEKSKSEKLEEEAAQDQEDRFGEIKMMGNEQEGGAKKGADGAEGEVSSGFYLPKEATFFSLNHASSHVWPINGVVINELLRRNQEDHLIDTLRAARKMLDRISALHNTAMLIPTDEMKMHINRLEKCVLTCQRQRITHHANAIHPLQSTFEDLIEQFRFELRVFKDRSITVGHNARKMINVSRYLRRRMLIRDHALALVSPLMRRVLIKLLALRMWIQLIEKDKNNYLLGPKKKKGKNNADDEFAAFADIGSDSDDDQYGNDGPSAKYDTGEDVFGGGGDEELAVNVPLLDDEEFGFETADNLAKALANKDQYPTEDPAPVSPSFSTGGGNLRRRDKSAVSFAEGAEDSGLASNAGRSQSVGFIEPEASASPSASDSRVKKKKSVGFGALDESVESKKDQ